MEVKMNIDINHLSVSFDDQTILDDISCHFPSGKFSCLVGENGSGKSTLLKTLTKDINKYQGNITDLKSNDYSYIPQNIEDPEFLSVKEVVKLGFYQSVMSDEAITFQSRQLLNRFDIQNLECRSFSEISIGQKQRVWLAFALAQEKKVILMDEPLASVDLQSRKNFYSILNTVSQEGKTLIIVTHDLEIAMEFCDYMVHLDHGTVLFEGPPKKS
tara:strand:+ start:1142 stop:1786 length:645 start_codon:yes stop_codon:yes gene_type:complete